LRAPRRAASQGPMSKCLSLYGDPSTGASRNQATTFLFAIQFGILFILNVISLVRVRRAQRRWEESGYLEEAKPTPMLLPIYFRLLWAACLTLGISIGLAQIEPLSIIQPNSTKASIFYAFSYMFQQIVFDATVMVLQSQGAGRRTYLRAIRWATFIGVIHFGLRFVYAMTIRSSTWWVPYFFLLLSNGSYALWYLVVWVYPDNRHIFRRPALRPYAGYFFFVFSLEIVSTTMRLTRVDVAYCFTFVSTIIFYTLSPWALFKACAQDS
jgi:hypothetical protein